MFQCEVCNKSFDTKRQLLGHKSIHRENGRYGVSRKKFEISNCKHCGKKNKNHVNVYCSSKCQQEWQYYNVNLPKILSGEGGNLLRFLIERDGRKCSCCKLEEWNNKPIPLDVEHIDGNPTNNFPSNICLLCPNCHRQTDTWGMKAGRRSLREMGQMGRRCLDTAKTNGSIPLSPTKTTP